MSKSFILMSVDYTEARDRVTHVFYTSKNETTLILAANKMNNQAGGRSLIGYLYPMACSDEVPRRTKTAHFWIQEVEALDE